LLLILLQRLLQRLELSVQALQLLRAALLRQAGALEHRLSFESRQFGV
jgi:hypothetical protein